MSILAIVGVIVSAAAMIVVLSGFSGLKNYSLEFISSVSPDLKVTSVKGKSFEFTEKMQNFLDDKKVIYSSSYEDKALLSINENNRIVVIKGVGKNFPKENINSIMYQGNWFKPGLDEIVVGWSTAFDLGISTQDALNPVRVYIPKAGKNQVFSERDVLRSRNMLAAGIFSINEELNKSVVFTGLETSRLLFGLGKNEVGAINLFNLDNSALSSEVLASFFGPDFEVENRVQQNKTLYKMLNTEQIAIYLIFSLIVVVALFNMFGALLMMVLEKRENLKTLMVLGLSNKEVGKIFFYQGLLISFSGCTIGLLIGSLLLFLQHSFSILMITPSLAYPIGFELNNYLVVFVTVMVLGAIAATIVSHHVKKSILQISPQ